MSTPVYNMRAILYSRRFDLRILQPTSWLHATPDPLELKFQATSVWECGGAAVDTVEGRRTNDEGDHGGSIASGSLKTLDELLDLPDLNLSAAIVSFDILHQVCCFVGFRWPLVTVGALPSRGSTDWAYRQTEREGQSQRGAQKRRGWPSLTPTT